MSNASPNQAINAANARSGTTVYRLRADCRRKGVPCHEAYLREYHRLPDHLTEFRALACDMYIGVNIVVTCNISTVLVINYRQLGHGLLHQVSGN